MSDGSIKVDTRLDNSKIKADLNELERLVADGASGVTEEFAQKVEKLSATWSRLESQQSKNNAKISEFKSRMEELQKYMDIDTKAGIKIEEGQLNEFAELSQKLKEAEANAKGLNAAMSKVGIDTTKLNDNLNGSVKESKKLDSSTKSVNANLSKSPKYAEGMSSGIKGAVKSLVKYAGMLIGIRAIYSGIQKAVNAWMQATEEGAQAQADLQGIWESLGQTIAPVIQWLISLLQQLLGYANAITKAFFGFELFTKSAKKNLGGAVDQAKELRKQLAGFDEMNILGSNGQQNAAGGVGGVTPTEIGTPDITGFKQAVDQLKKWLDEIWNSEIVQNYWNSIQTIVMAHVEMIKSVLLNIWDNVLLSWEEMFPFLEVGFWNMVEYWRRVLEDIAIVSEEWFPIITESVNTFVDSIFETFRPITTFIARVWSEFTQIMLDIWNEHGLPILDEFMKFMNTTIELFNQIWTKIIDPIIRPAIQMLQDLWDNHLKDLIKEFGGFIGELIKGALEIWNEVIAPIISWIVDKLSPIISWLADTVFTKMGTSIGNVADRIKEAISIMRSIFGGLIDFIVGAFTGDWERAWKGVVRIFEGIWNGLKFVFTSPINAMISGLNFFIRGLNKIKIPNWVPGVGGKGINISEIPKLARGGITTGATTAIIGEAGREAVIPLQNNTDWIHDFLDLANENGGIGGSSGPSIIQLVVSGKTLAEIVNDENKKDNFNTNGRLSYGS